jgi:hypothetical protein
MRDRGFETMLYKTKNAFGVTNYSKCDQCGSCLERKGEVSFAKMERGEGTRSKEQTTVRIDTELRNKIQREADRRDVSFNEMINLLIYKGMEFVNRRLL